MKSVLFIPAAALALCAFYTAAAAMSTVPFSGQTLGPKAPPLNGSVRNPYDPDSANTPRNYGSRFDPYFAGPNAGQPPSAQNGSDPGFLNVDPFDPNSVVNSFDRQLYANPYPYDPIHNPYGQGRSRYAPNAPNVPMGQGIPFGH